MHNNKLEKLLIDKVNKDISITKINYFWVKG